MKWILLWVVMSPNNQQIFYEYPDSYKSLTECHAKSVELAKDFPTTDFYCLQDPSILKKVKK